MSVKVMAKVWAHSRCVGGEMLVMLALADFANDHGECWPSIPVLAQKARLTERQVQYLLPKLEQAGELQINRSSGGRNRRNRYLITVTKNPEDISLKKIHRNDFSEIHSTETVKSTSPALNRHRTINKSSAKSLSVSSPSRRGRKVTLGIPPEFERFYSAYPRHVAKADALRAWLKLAPTPELVADIMMGVERYAETVKDSEPKYIKHPASWLNARRWEDEAVTNGVMDTRKAEPKDIGNGMVEFDGLKMTRETYERKYGTRA